MKNSKNENILTTITLAVFEAGARPTPSLMADVIKRLKTYGHFTTEDEFIGAARVAAHQAVAAQRETGESSVSTQLFAVPDPGCVASGRKDSAPARPAQPGRTLKVVKAGKLS